MKPSRRAAAIPYLGICLAAAVVALFIYGRIDYSSQRFPEWDLNSYHQMARAAPGFNTTVPQPFVYRILGPFIAGVLPIPDPWNFYALSAGASVLLVALFFLFLCRVGITPLAACYSTILFIFNKYLFGFPIWDFFQIDDILAMVFILGMFWSILDRKWAMFSALLALGALTREVTLLLAPTALVYLAERRLLATDGVKALAAIVPGVVCFAAIRWIIASEEALKILDAFLVYSHKMLLPETWGRLLINSFVPLSLTPLVFWRHSWEFARQNKYMVLFVILVFSSTWFAGNNERLMAPAAIIFYLLTAQLVQTYFITSKMALVLLLICAALASQHHLYGTYPLPDRLFTIVLTAATLGVATAVAAAVSFQQRRLKPPPASSLAI